MQASAPGAVSGGIYVFWIYFGLCSTDSAQVTINVPAFSVDVAISTTATAGQVSDDVYVCV